MLEFSPPGVSNTACVDVTVINDGFLEEQETLCLTLTNTDPSIIVDRTSAITCITIDNINCKFYMHFILLILAFYIYITVVEIGFRQSSYVVEEADGSVEICVSLTGNNNLAIRVSFTTVDETTTGC